MEELYNKVDFIVSGGALQLLSEFLSTNGYSSLVVEPDGDRYMVLDAVGMAPETLVLDEGNLGISSLFSDKPLTSAFDVEAAEGNEKWPTVVRIRSSGDNSIYILLRVEADEDLLAELYPFAGMIHIWRIHHKIEDTEARLARLSYMILATKNTLASVFEPMPLDYFASFISDVIHESLFPKAAAVVQDDGEKLVHLKGDKVNIPEREGIFTEPILTPVPVVLKGGSPYRVILPIAEGNLRLFCLMVWDKYPDSQVLNFLELLGSLAVRAIVINNLRAENIAAASHISSSEFTMLSLSNVLRVLREQTGKAGFFSSVADIMIEQSQMSECVLAVWDEDVRGYVMAEKRSGGIFAPAEPGVMRTGVPVASENVGGASFDLKGIGTDSLLRAWGLGDCPWSCMESMRYVFPIDNGSTLCGFIAAGSDKGAGIAEQQMASLSIVAQFAAYEFYKFSGSASAARTDSTF